MLQNRHIGDIHVSEPAKSELLSPHIVWPSGISSTTQPLNRVSSMSGTLSTTSGLLANLPVVSTTMLRVLTDMISTY